MWTLISSIRSSLYILSFFFIIRLNPAVYARPEVVTPERPRWSKVLLLLFFFTSLWLPLFTPLTTRDRLASGQCDTVSLVLHARQKN